MGLLYHISRMRGSANLIRGSLDFGLNEAENLPDLLNKYVYFFNNQRPAAALGYKSPVQYKTELGFL